MTTQALRNALRSLAELAALTSTAFVHAQPRDAMPFTAVEIPTAGDYGTIWTTEGRQTQIRGALVVNQSLSREFGMLYTVIEINAHFGMDFSGPVWGTFALFATDPVVDPEAVMVAADN